MLDKKNVNNFFFSDESDLEDFYLDNPEKNKKNQQSEVTKGIDEIKTSPLHTPTRSIETATKAFTPDHKHDWFNCFDDVYFEKGSGENAGDNREISDEDAIDEILNTDIVERNEGNDFDYFSDLAVDTNSTADNSGALKERENLAELNVLKQKIRDATESFSQINDSIEILSSDIENVNRDFSSYPSVSQNVTTTPDKKVIVSSPTKVFEDQKIPTTTSADRPTAEPNPKSEMIIDLKTVPVADDISSHLPIINSDQAKNDVPSQQVKANLNSDAVSTCSIPVSEDRVASSTQVEKPVTLPETPKLSVTPNNTSMNISPSGEINSKANENSSAPNESSVVYSKLFVDLQQQVAKQVKEAVQSEIDRLIQAQSLLREEVNEFRRKRDLAKDLSDLNTRFSSIIEQKSQSPEIAEDFYQNVPESAAEVAAPSPADIAMIEAQRKSILEKTKNIMDQSEATVTSNNDERFSEAEVDHSATANVDQNNRHDESMEDFTTIKDEIKKDVIKEIKKNISELVNEKISNLKPNTDQDKIAVATEQLKTRMIIDAADAEKKLNQLIEKTVTEELGLSFLNDDNKLDGSDEDNFHLSHNAHSGEEENEKILPDIDHFRQEQEAILKNPWTSNPEMKDLSEPSDAWFAKGHQSRNREGSPFKTPRSANLVFDPNSQIKGSNLIFEYVNALVKKRKNRNQK